ncbi:response regulator [Neorhizobium sp. DAR64861/K0K2]|uniref:response regulator n=1 Tax=unclassified Neorhizobium TaxID=2629175 RepID=UPI003D2D06B9
MSKHMILLLEDQPLISLDIEDALGAAGLNNVINLRSKQAALEWLQKNVPSIVILDLHLTDGDCYAVIQVLQDARIPFVVYSGSEKPQDWENELFSDGVWIDKPADPAFVVSVVEQKLAAVSARA